ncbi:MAG TPA: SdpI family protein [Chitinophagaceae bacterium]|nr:SdpI family protein [Chitinophagaceae bacterium]
MDKFLKRFIWLFIIAPAAYLAIVWNTIPDTVPLHANLKGVVDRYGSKNELITMTLVLTVVNVLVYLLLPQVYRIDPKRYASENKSRLHRIAFAVSVFIAAVLCLLIYSSIHENIKFSARFILAGVGLLFAVIGNYMYTIKPNYFAGIRLPWTLNNDENWKKTHLLGGKLMFGGGLLIAVICLFASFSLSMIMLFAILSLIILITCIYSYNLYKKLNGHH